MDPEFWRRVEELFQEALERPPEVRQPFLEEACGNDADLRAQVELLLAKDAQAKSFLEPAPLHEESMTAATGLIGRQFGPYRVMSLLGAGGMGEVYRAHDSKLGRDVAIKTLPSEFAHDPERLARFRGEARTLASLNHPNIAAIYGLEESGGADCLVLELVEGETPRGPLPVAEALRIAKQIAEALEAAHSKGIIHRDLKPANIKVTSGGHVKVLDFGLAKAILGTKGDADLSDEGTLTDVGSIAGHIAGTPGYMSPEQARGGEVDQRADIWAFGCVLYELLTGLRAFAGDTALQTIAAVVEREPDWRALPAKTPTKIRELLRWCLQKEADRRLHNIAEAGRTIAETQQGWNRWTVVALAGVGLALFVVGAVPWSGDRARPPDRSDWVQLTKFPDPVSQPALSPDGRMLTFVRGPRTTYGIGQVYVKELPDGEAVQLTNDDLRKAVPVFSPDGERVAYTVVDPQFNWDTWVVPVTGGQPQQWQRNASGLTWTGPHLMLFSEIKVKYPMGIVVARDDRTNERDVYFPRNDRGMATRSQASPDGKWALLAEMAANGNWDQCRVVPMDGSSSGRQVGPPGAPCSFGAWSTDGKWMYLTSKAGGLNHIWRQHFPDGEPEQFTFGLTEEEGIAMTPDGGSLVTAVALESSTLWIHDARGERQISVLEGNAAYPKFAPDGKKLYYRIVKAVPIKGTKRDPGEIWVADVESGHSERVVPGFQPLEYDISPDGRQVVMAVPDSGGNLRLWLAPVDRSSEPKQIPNVQGQNPLFDPGGDILFRRVEGASSFLYRVRTDGTGLSKALEQPVFYADNVSPDGRWIRIWGPLKGNVSAVVQLVPLDGGPAVVIGSNTVVQWSLSGDSLDFVGCGS